MLQYKPGYRKKCLIFLSYFKNAIVQPLLKKPTLDPKSLDNFRPISKLPFLSKVLERVVAEQLIAFLNRDGLFETFQSRSKLHSLK